MPKPLIHTRNPVCFRRSPWGRGSGSGLGESPHGGRDGREGSAPVAPGNGAAAARNLRFYSGTHRPERVMGSLRAVLEHSGILVPFLER